MDRILKSSKIFSDGYVGVVQCILGDEAVIDSTPLQRALPLGTLLSFGHQQILGDVTDVFGVWPETSYTVRLTKDSKKKLGRLTIDQLEKAPISVFTLDHKTK
jgi:hypothetical protein